MGAHTIRAAAFVDKGGCGKTTSTAHIGSVLQRSGIETLLIDLAGKQGDLTKHFGEWDSWTVAIEDGKGWPNISTVFDDNWEEIDGHFEGKATQQIILESETGPDLIPAHPGLDTLDEELKSIDDAHERYSILGDFLDEYVDPLKYEAVLVDLPGLANNVAYNGLWACKHVIVPVEAGKFEDDQASALRQDLTKIDEKFDVSIDLSLVLPNKIDTQRILDQRFLDEWQDEYPEAIAPTHVPYSQDVRWAATDGHTAFELEDPSATAKRACDAYEQATDALVSRIKGGIHA